MSDAKAPKETIQPCELAVLRRAHAALEAATRVPQARLDGAMEMLKGRYGLRDGVDEIDLRTGAIIRAGTG